MIYSLDDKESQGLLTIWKNSALTQLGDHIPQEASAFFDLIKRLPKMFMKHHVFAIGVANEYIQSQRVKTEKSLNAISSRDCIAPYLQREQLDLYISFVGLDRVIVEINYAYCEGLVIGQPALNLAENWINQCPDDWVEGINRTLYPLSKPLMLNPTVDKVEPKVDKVEPKVDKVEPKVDNVEPKTVISSSIEPEIIEDVKPFEEVLLKNLPPVNITKPVEPAVRIQNTAQLQYTNRKIPSPKNALDLVLADPYQSRAIFGAQRTGKSYFAAVASEKMTKTRGTKVYHLNLLSYVNPLHNFDEDETYWQHAYESLRCDLSSLDAYEAKYYVKAAIDLVSRCYADPEPALLICDEIAYLGSTGNQHRELLTDLLTILADKITVMASSGKKRQKAVWTIAPEFVAGGLTQDAKSVKKLRLLYLSIHPDRTVNWDGQAIGFDAELYDQVARNYEITPAENLPDADRVAFTSGVWMPIGELGEMAKPTPVIPEVTLEVYLTKVLSNAQKSGRDISQAYNYIESIMEHKYITELGLSQGEVEAEIKRLIPKVIKVAA